MIIEAQKSQSEISLKKWGVPSLVVLMRILFGLGWLLAGITKIVGKTWFSEPGVFLRDYLITALGKDNVPEFYKYYMSMWH
ncbi:hypothetical protein [Ammoniphilus sp. 3BR4]|uniref:hypothetical protein n=1 Tax=Ammoniphilus sp. 3BR4 TaxID=3158265 RepID=UPI00346740B6